jgi:hypothetical protein
MRKLLRLEALALFLIGLVLYAKGGYGWGRFAIWILVPDLSLLGYLLNPRAGAIIYNTVHSEIGPVALAALALLGVLPAALPYAIIWGIHVCMDRSLGYGLKYMDAFRHTHLGTVGKDSAPASQTAAA